MRLSDYEYELPDSLIADRPPAERGSTRLLVLRRSNGSITDDYYRNLPALLQPGDVLVMNNTSVFKARLLAVTDEGKPRELLILERHGETYDPHRMEVMYRRKLRPNQKLHVADTEITVEAIHGDGTATITSSTSLTALAEKHGTVPLPPYMHRTADESDIERYQTVFAKQRGSVAAPTASLNLTDDILQHIRNKGVITAELTLHVGLGTFMPIRTDDVTEHTMHSEYYSIPTETIKAIRTAKKNGKRVIAVGTTVTRTLEYTADALLNDAAAIPLQGEANIFIYPGYTFKIVDGMVTNFHAPHSTVLMMAAAFAGWEHLKTAYEHAKQHNYAFLSYGDSMFIC